MLDETQARLYRVSTKRLYEHVKRNRERFPNDFMFQLTAKEAEVRPSATKPRIRHRSGSAR